MATGAIDLCRTDQESTGKEDVKDELNALFDGIYTFKASHSEHSSSGLVFKGISAEKKIVWAKLVFNAPHAFDDIYTTYLLGQNGCGPKIMHLATLWKYDAFIMVLEDADDAVKRIHNNPNFQRITDDMYLKTYPDGSEEYHKSMQARDAFFDHAVESTYIDRFRDIHSHNLIRYFDKTTKTTAYIMLDIETQEGRVWASTIDEDKKRKLQKTESFKIFKDMYNSMVANLESELEKKWCVDMAT